MAEQNKKAWYLANTTVRNPRRIKEGLRLLVESPLHGNLVGKIREQQFAILLNDAGIVHVNRLQDHSMDASDVGRKWRAAIMQMGFITPGPQLSKQPYTLTPNGERLLNSRTLPEEQECFLRALLALQLPSQIEQYIKVPPFSPLRIVLEVLSGLERAKLDAWISQNEMASIVQLVTRTEDVNEAVQKIASSREQAKKAINAKRFAREYREKVAQDIKGQSGQTLADYADSNFRYLKLTGLFAEIGHRLRFADYKQTIINQILSTPYTPIFVADYLNVLWNGAILPTDNANKAIEAIESTANILRSRAGIEAVGSLALLARIPSLHQVSEADLAQLRLQLEDDLFKLLESDFAKKQAKQWEDIINYLRALMRSDRHLVPVSEAPAYFEWTLWRAFLAINSLINKPWDARRFRLDEEFRPISPAASGGPDMIFEFEDFVVVVEVTLTTGSRQEAAEGEPVRRHVADLVNSYKPQGKRVYGLFLATKIDTNTAETFRHGSWYRPDDTRLELEIVPFTLKQFTDLFEAAFQGRSGLDYKTLEEIIMQCIHAKSDADAPNWKNRIGEYISKVIQQM